MRRTATPLIVTAVVLACMSPPAPASAQSSSNAEGPVQSAQIVPQLPREMRRPDPPKEDRRWSLSAAASNVFETNIDRNQDNNQAAGVVLGLGGQFRNRTDRPTFTAQYQLGGHMYAGAPRWDRVSHNARAAYERRLLKALTFEGVGEISLKGSTEDRELGNQYIVSPRLQFRLSRSLRLGLEGGYRLKHYPDRTRNATNPYGGLRFVHRLGAFRWELGYRYEENHSDTTRNRYRRSTYSGEVLVPFGRHDSFGFEVKGRSRRYERTVRLGDQRVPLRDRKWSFSPQWVHVLNPGVQVRASYDFETRGANDPGRNYGAHSTVLAIERRW